MVHAELATRVVHSGALLSALATESTLHKLQERFGVGRLIYSRPEPGLCKLAVVVGDEDAGAWIDGVVAADPWIRETMERVLRLLAPETIPTKDLAELLGILLALDERGIRSLSLREPLQWAPPEQEVDPLLTEELVGDLSMERVERGVGHSAVGVALLRVLFDSSPERPAFETIETYTGYARDGLHGERIAVVVHLQQQRRIPTTSSTYQTTTLFQFETNIDDMTPEHLALAVEILMEHGAADAWITPIVMKKGRPAHTLHCLCRSKEPFASLLFQHTSTLGVRVSTVERLSLERKMMNVDGIDVKVGYMVGGGMMHKVKAEFDHCRKVALATGENVTVVARRAEAEALRRLERES